MKKKVLGISTLYKKTMTKYFILGFVALAFLGFLIAVADQDSPIYGIVLIALSLFLVALAIIVNLMPSESLLYDEENKQLIIYGTRSLLFPKKQVIINIEDIIYVGYYENGTISKRQYNDGLYIHTSEKKYKIISLDSFKKPFQEIEKILPDSFFLSKFVEEKNIDKILSFDDRYFFNGIFEILHKENFYNNIREEKFEIYIFMYFLLCLYNGGLHYFMTYSKKYLTLVMGMYKKLGLDDLSYEMQKLYYLYPKTEGQEYFEDLFEKFKDIEEVDNANEKLNRVGNYLIQNDKDFKVIRLLKKYILDNKIDLR